MGWILEVCLLKWGCCWLVGYKKWEDVMNDWFLEVCLLGWVIIDWVKKFNLVLVVIFYYDYKIINFFLGVWK